MELTYDLKLTDLINFYLHTTRHSKLNHRKIRIKKLKLFLITLGISLILQRLYVRPISPVYYVVSFVIALLPVIFYTVYAERLIQRKFRKFHKYSKEPNVFGTYYLSIRKDGLEEIVKGGQKEVYKWNEIENIVKVKNYIYIYSNAIHAVIVPLRIFSSLDDCFYFLNELKRHIKDSTEQSIEVKNL